MAYIVQSTQKGKNAASAATLVAPDSIIATLRDLQARNDLAWRLRMEVLPYDGPRSWPERYRRQQRLMRDIVHQFAELNGWRSTWREIHYPARGFNPGDIGKRARGTCPEIFRDSDALDHRLYFKREGRYAAIVSQTYDYTKDAEGKLAEIADEHGLVVHSPPHPYANFYFPEMCRIFVFTLPDHKIRWLPEQLHGMRQSLLITRRLVETVERMIMAA
jgi:hypothetical protein